MMERDTLGSVVRASSVSRRLTSLRDQADGFTESPSSKWDRTVRNTCKVRGWLEATLTENKWGRATPGRGSKGHSSPAGGRAGEASRPRSVCALGTAVGAGSQRLAQGSAGQLARVAAGGSGATERQWMLGPSGR